ncbi:MAG: TraR/DksA C4-type zinc finger protein [Gammaproteobacteria bacterium]|jgi:DnaK suppressor protein
MAFRETETGLIRSRLLALQAELTGQQEAGMEAGKTVELDQTSVGRLSRMDALQGQAMSKESGRRRSLTLQKVAAALRRLDRGEYGDCLRCGEPIAAQRLTFDPAATLCIECARNSET